MSIRRVFILARSLRAHARIQNQLAANMTGLQFALGFNSLRERKGFGELDFNSSLVDQTPDLRKLLTVRMRGVTRHANIASARARSKAPRSSRSRRLHP